MNQLRREIILWARTTAHLIRCAKMHGAGPALLDQIDSRINLLWNTGCHSDRIGAVEKETCRRCANTLALMLIR